jgi:hypothetical protein
MHLAKYGMAGGFLKRGLTFVDHRGAALVGAALLVAAVLGESVVPARAVGICGNNNFVPVADPNATGELIASHRDKQINQLNQINQISARSVLWSTESRSRESAR